MKGDSTQTPRVVAEMTASAVSAEVVRTAVSHCREHGAELVLVWVVDPALFGATRPGHTGTIGTWGLVTAPALALRLVHGTGVAARVVVRVGERRRVLEEEREAAGAVKVFTAADVAVPRCPACGARYDSRGVHFCPAGRRPHAEPRAA